MPRSHLHSPPSRRDLLRVLGVGGLGLTTALPPWAGTPPSAPADADGLILDPEGKTPLEPLFQAPLWDLNDRPARIQPRAGRPLVVNFWARWCGPCRAEIPELVALVRRKEGVDVVGINLEKDPAPVRDFALAHGVNYPVYQAREGGLDLMRALGNTDAGLPYTVVLNRRGRLAASRIGLLTHGHLVSALRHARA